MLRPFMFIGISALVASYTALNSIWISVTVLLLTAVITLLPMVKKSNQLNKGVIIALIFVMLAVRIVTLGVTIENKTRLLESRQTDIIAEITEVDYSTKYSSSLSLKIKSCGISEANGLKVKATFSGKTTALPGDIINAGIIFTPHSGRHNAYNFGNGFYYSCAIDEIYSVRDGSGSFWRMIYNVRQAIISAIDQTGINEEGAVIKALVIGDDSYISTDFYQMVKTTGVAHMLVVSGMHLSILCGVLLNAVRGRTNPWAAAVFGGFSAVIIMAVCLFHVSILRASIAYFAMLLGRRFNKSIDPLSSLGFGAAVAVFTMPYIFYNVAFLLSLAATFAVLYPSKLIIDAVNFNSIPRFGKPLKLAFDILVIALCSTACTMPITVYCFGYVALISPISNLAVTFSMNAALILGVLAVTLFFLPLGRFISIPVFLLCRLFVKFFILTVQAIGQNNFGVLFIPKDKIIYCILAVAAFILLVRMLSRYLISKREEKYRA